SGCLGSVLLPRVLSLFLGFPTSSSSPSLVLSRESECISTTVSSARLRSVSSTRDGTRMSTDPTATGVYYGTRDTRLMNVKLSELPAWFSRRELTVGAFYNEVMRNIWRVHHKWYSGPVYGNTIKTIFRFIFCYSFLCWLVKSHRYLDFQKTMYHW
ncbi:hypothetical protein PENTCL1PPCAC_6578, partial [Pristionchus entomophagus]